MTDLTRIRRTRAAAAALALAVGLGACDKSITEPTPQDSAANAVVPCADGSAGSFPCQGLDLLGHLSIDDMGGTQIGIVNDVWGWTDPETGSEYALIGRAAGTSFADVTDPINPRYLGTLPMSGGAWANVWRDLKVYADHAFIVADGAGEHGMQVFDLRRLRDIEAPQMFDQDARYVGIASAHNIAIDTVSGFAFVLGANGGGETCGGGLHMIDISSPLEPVFAGCFADPETGRAMTGYTHDAQCVTYSGPDAEHAGRQICLGSNETGLSIADVTNKTDPIALARASYPNLGYAHQGWLSEDQRYFYMNDELDELRGLVDGTRTLIWDVADLDDPILAGEYIHDIGATDHNLFIKGRLMYQSNYLAGLRVVDILNPETPTTVGFFDTVPGGDNGPGMDGSWSNYPFFDSGTLVVTSKYEGVFLVRLQ